MILNKDVLINNIVTELSDNSTGEISPYDIRHNLLDIIDSVHVLLNNHNIKALNFDTPETRSVRVGTDALSKINLAGYFSIDNTAIGNSALKANYRGIHNTSVGSSSLFCNIYGENNVALGYLSLAGNTIGHGNIGVGNFALHNNKSGNFNIAIGHGAGYYAKDVSNKLFIASHNVDSNYICDNNDGVGLTPLVYGDLDTLKFGIGVNELHSHGTLQVGGHITPSINESHNLGSNDYKFQNLHLSSGIYFNQELYFKQTKYTDVSLHGNLKPYYNNNYSIGTPDNVWNFGYFNNIYVSGLATINRFNAIESCNYFCKTINLASSGNISLDGGGPVSLYDYSGEQSPITSNCGYLNDEQLSGAGFSVNSSGTSTLNSANYNRRAVWGFLSGFGNLTTVGTNGGKSAYGTYDQSGNVFEWVSENVNDEKSVIRGGSFRSTYYADNQLNNLSKDAPQSRYEILTNNVSFDISFRLASYTNPLNLDDFVIINYAGNLADENGYGNVNEQYQISKYPITNEEYVDFLNSVAKTDTYNLYYLLSDNYYGITRSGQDGSWIYSVKNNMDKKPCVRLSWFTCARYCNWLHNNKPTGAQDSSTTEDGAYYLNGKTAGSIVDRNQGAKYFIPSENQWYKAAYYKSNGFDSGYWTYATQSDTPPTFIGATQTGDGVVPFYVREYYFKFFPSYDGFECSKSDDTGFWNSNISVHLSSGTHLATDLVIFPSSINIVNDSGCFGFFSKEEDIFFSHKDILSHPPYSHPSGYLAGVGNVNFYAESGVFSDFIINLASPESGVSVRQRFLNGIKNKTIDPINNKDILNGFEIEYIDNANSLVYGPISDRLVIGSYENTSDMVNTLTVMKSNSEEGIVGISDLTPNSEFTIPETSLNIRSSKNAIGRFTAENEADTISAIQLLGPSNCLVSGLEINYHNGSGISDISMFVNSEKDIFFRFYENKTVGLLNSSGSKPPLGDMLTMGDIHNNHALISMYENSNIIDSRPRHSKIYVKQKIAPSQEHTIYVIDGSGNLHDLIVNPLDVTDGRALYTDDSGNTFGGLYCPDKRDDLNNVARNTAIGYKSLSNISSGDDNTIFGFTSGSGITTGSRNSIFGSYSANSVVDGNDNIIIGSYNLANSNRSVSSNILIGNKIGADINSDHNFIIGDDDIILLEGKLGPNNSNKYLSMPSGGKFILQDSNNVDHLRLQAKYFDVIDSAGNDYPDSNFSFRFIGNETSEILKLNHSADPLNVSPLYKEPLTPRPFMELLGDFKLLGSIRFYDQTSLSSASFLDEIESLNSEFDDIKSEFSDTKNQLNDLQNSFVEGYVNEKIEAPISAENPTTGTLYLRDKNWQNPESKTVTLVNRDATLSIHSGAYVIAIVINDEFRPLWISASDTTCQCCR